MTYQDIHATDVGTLLQRDDLTVIDMRDSQSQDRGRLPSAQPSSDAVINTLISKRRSNPAVLVYCYQGNSSRDLCSFLTQLGLTQVYNLQGGWDAWERVQAAGSRQ